MSKYEIYQRIADKARIEGEAAGVGTTWPSQAEKSLRRVSNLSFGGNHWRFPRFPFRGPSAIFVLVLQRAPASLHIETITESSHRLDRLGRFAKLLSQSANVRAQAR